MPELPEVETIKLGLARLITGKTISKVRSNNPKSFPNTDVDVKRFLLGSKIRVVDRRGKALIIDLDSGYSLLIHLKMTGQLVYDDNHVHFGAGHPTDSLISKLPDKSTRVVIGFSDKSKLYFNDQRKFGWMRLHPSAAIGDLSFFKRLGPEPLSTDFSWQELRDRLSLRPRSPIKAVLLDQGIIAGIGNIYADESLWGAKIHPATPVSALKDSDYKRLHKSLLEILKLSLDQGGSTDRTYVDAEGKKGNYLQFARVFRRQGKPCPRCGRAIIKIRLAGRGTHLCPNCQKPKSTKPGGAYN
jgi:formamidopyrimidine-DNA glycosylase